MAKLKDNYIDLIGMYIEDAATQKYDLNGLNCISFAARAVYLMTGENILYFLDLTNFETHDAMMQAYYKVGGQDAIVDLLTDAGAEEVSSPQRGDIVADNLTGAFGVYWSTGALLYGRNGLISMPKNKHFQYYRFKQ